MSHKHKYRFSTVGWEQIGQCSYGKWETEKSNVPEWVLKAENNIRKKESGSSLGGKAYILKGHTFEYLLAFAGQGGPIVTYYRRKRKRQ